jgi:uncharacterized LabA/DUF88 family protein
LYRAKSREREYLFIDGGCLRSTVKAACKGLFGDENLYRPFLPSFVGSFDKVFYYDAVSGRQHGEGQEAYTERVEPEHERFSRFQALDRVHVALGKIVGKDRRQKGVDVRLAVDMMTHAFRGKIERATLFAGDADFEPLVQALVNEGLHVTLWHPPQANKDLKGAADSNRAFDFQHDFQCFTLNDQVPAFQMAASGSGQIDLSKHGAANIVRISEQQFSGVWDGDTLMIFQIAPTRDSANHISFRAPGSSLANALIAFQHIYGWDVAETGEQWIRSA